MCHTREGDGLELGRRRQERVECVEYERGGTVARLCVFKVFFPVVRGAGIAVEESVIAHDRGANVVCRYEEPWPGEE